MGGNDGTEERQKTVDVAYHCPLCGRPFLSRDAGVVHILVEHANIDINQIR